MLTSHYTTSIERRAGLLWNLASAERHRVAYGVLEAAFPARGPAKVGVHRERAALGKS